MDGISNMIVFYMSSHKHWKGLSINKSKLLFIVFDMTCIIRYDC